MNTPALPSGQVAPTVPLSDEWENVLIGTKEQVCTSGNLTKVRVSGRVVRVYEDDHEAPFLGFLAPMLRVRIFYPVDKPGLFAFDYEELSLEKDGDQFVIDGSFFTVNPSTILVMVFNTITKESFSLESELEKSGSEPPPACLNDSILNALSQKEMIQLSPPPVEKVQKENIKENVILQKNFIQQENVVQERVIQKPVLSKPQNQLKIFQIKP